jgi:hypothetical protein
VVAPAAGNRRPNPEVTAMSATRQLAVAVLTAALAGAASAQSLRPSLRTTPPAPVTWYASVTLTNPTDLVVECKVNWPGTTPTTVVLAAGESKTLRTSFAAGGPEPKLTVKFETGVVVPHGISMADYRAGFDMRPTNVGRIYGFGHYPSMVGDLLTLTPR